MNVLQPEIYVTCRVGCAVVEHGRWIDATQSLDEIMAEIQEVFDSCRPSELKSWQCTNSKGFGTYRIDFTKPLAAIHEIAVLIAQYDEIGAAVLNEFTDVDTARKMITDYYYGQFESEEEFVKLKAEEFMNIPEHLVGYLDYKKIAKDWFMSDYFAINCNNCVHVFLNR